MVCPREACVDFDDLMKNAHAFVSCLNFLKHKFLYNCTLSHSSLWLQWLFGKHLFIHVNYKRYFEGNWSWTIFCEKKVKCKNGSVDVRSRWYSFNFWVGQLSQSTYLGAVRSPFWLWYPYSDDDVLLTFEAKDFGFISGAIAA